MRVATWLVSAVLSTFLVCPTIADAEKRIPPPIDRQRAATVAALYDLWPQASQILDGTVTDPIDSLFASSVRGRVSPLGTANNLATAKQMIFGVVALWPNLSPTPTVTSVTVNAITPLDDQVFVDVFINLPALPFIFVPAIQVRQTGFFRLNEASQIVSFDLTLPYLGTLLRSGGVGPDVPAFVASSAHAVCVVASTSCLPADTGYADVTDCENHLSSIPAGSFDRTNSNSVLCRLFEIRSSSAPSCAVIGQSGGTACVDLSPVDSYVTGQY